MNADIKISVVIPVLGDADCLAEILANFTSGRPKSEVSPHEIIVVDGANDDDCADLCTKHDCVYVRTRAGRGHQLHKGANIAEGSVLWFLHADARPPISSLSLIRREIEGGAIGGYFRFKFGGDATWYKKLLAYLINARTKLGVPYGDQGLFFCKLAYYKAGGFPDAPLFEEVPLVRSARSNGRFVQITAPIVVSPRRWERDGWTRRTFENRLLALGYMAHVSPQTLAGRYSSKC